MKISSCKKAGGFGKFTETGRSSWRTACLYKTGDRGRMASDKMPDRLKRTYSTPEAHYHMWRIRKQSKDLPPIWMKWIWVVPRNRVNEMVTYLHDLQKTVDIRIKSFGHAGDGNLHAYILKDELGDEEWEKRMKNAMELIYRKAHELRGQVYGEHGIGFAKKPYLMESLPEENIRLMNGIKQVFDPKNILNPHKVAQI